MKAQRLFERWFARLLIYTLQAASTDSCRCHWSLAWRIFEIHADNRAMASWTIWGLHFDSSSCPQRSKTAAWPFSAALRSSLRFSLHRLTSLRSRTSFQNRYWRVGPLGYHQSLCLPHFHILLLFRAQVVFKQLTFATTLPFQSQKLAIISS